MLQIKNTLGGGKPEGLYAWIKKEWIPPIIAENPSMSISASNNGTSDYKYIQISSADFDYTQIEGDYKEFFNGFKKSSNSYYFTVSGGYLYLNKDSSISLQITAFDKSKGIFTMASIYSSISATVSYSGSKTVKDGAVGNTIDYIVSDKETAYPDGGEKGGYYYEKVDGGITPEMFGCTKYEVGSFTLSSDNYTVSFNHTLGITPKAVIINENADVTGSKYINTYLATGSYGAYTQNNRASGDVRNGNTLDTSTVSVFANSTGTKFKAGVEYYYALFA